MIVAHQVSEAIQLEIIKSAAIAFGSLVTAIGGVMVFILDRTRRHAKTASVNAAETRDQVKNDHSDNLRDDLDAKFTAITTVVTDGFRHAAHERHELRQEVSAVRDEARELRKNLEAERERIRELEDTRPIPPRPHRKKTSL